MSIDGIYNVIIVAPHMVTVPRSVGGSDQNMVLDNVSILLFNCLFAEHAHVYCGKYLSTEGGESLMSENVTHNAV